MKIFGRIEIERVKRTAQVARYWSNLELKKIAGVVTGDVANVSGWKDEDKQGGFYREYFSKARTYTVTNYYGESGFQGLDGEILLDLRAPIRAEYKGRFDAVLCHTVLEHVFDINVAFRNLALLTRDLLIVVVPFCQIQHELESFGDYWRFTPSCLRELFKRNGMTVVYESSNEDFACGNYLLFCGSHRPDSHKSDLPPFTPLGLQGRWIGNFWWQRFLPKIWIQTRG